MSKSTVSINTMDAKSEIKPTKHIFCVGTQVGDKHKVLAMHSDGTNHDVGAFSTPQEAEDAAVAWKKKYLIKNE